MTAAPAELLSIVVTTIMTVAPSPPPQAVDFDTQIVPILTKAGCNAGACHGSAAGRGGFRLYLLGGKPDFDYRTIVHELEGRRINLALPEESLLLLKPTEQAEHEGGFRLDPKGPGAELILSWLNDGAPRLHKRQLIDFQITPQQIMLERPGETIDIRARARFDDGSVEDVTQWTVLSGGDEQSVSIDESGRANVKRRGRHTIIARYLDRVVAIGVTVPLRDQPVDLSGAEIRNFIDERIVETLKTLRLPASPQTDDAAFLRRISLDLTGTLPEPDAIRAFLADESKDKRARMIDRLLESDAFVEYWTLKFATMFEGNSKKLNPEGVAAFHHWIRDQIAANTPLDRMARQMITATGDSFENGAANFSRVAGGARPQAEYVSRVFMGVGLRCANCHDHPLDHWKQDDYHGLAAIFAKVQGGRNVMVSTRGEVTHPETGQPAVPRIPATRYLDETEDGRSAFANWLTQPDNEYFAASAVNRLWQQMMGRGLVEPVDDMRQTNPATHPALLNQLAENFVAHVYDIRHTLRLIANSAAYQRSSTLLADNAADDRFYSHALVRPLEAEVVADAMTTVTGVSERYGDQPLGTRAIALVDPLIESTSLDILGRCSREEPCEAAPADSGGLARTLHLINGPLINRKVAAKDGRLSGLLARHPTNDALVEELYLLVLGRMPNADESLFWAQQFDSVNNDAQRRQAFEDLLWSLLSCQEFLTNH